MNAFVLDTSVAAAWYLEEEHSAPSRVWQRRLLDAEASLVVPSLQFVELANLLRRLVRRGVLAAVLAQEIDALHRLAPIEVVDPPRESILETALEFEATAYDAVFIALARRLGLPLITAERATTPWVARLGAGAITVGS